MQNQLKQIYFIVRFGNRRYVSMKDVMEIQKTILKFNAFGHIVDKKIAKDYNGWNIPDVEYWLPFVDPKDK